MLNFRVVDLSLDGAQINRADAIRAEALRAHSPAVLLHISNISDSEARAVTAGLTDDSKPSSLRLSLQRGRRRSFRSLTYPPSPPSWLKGSSISDRKRVIAMSDERDSQVAIQGLGNGVGPVPVLKRR